MDTHEGRYNASPWQGEFSGDYVVYCYDRNGTLARDPFMCAEKMQELNWFGRTFALCDECFKGILIYKET